MEESAKTVDLSASMSQRLSQLAEVKGEDIVYLAPKKANWDLKRNVADKMDRLEKMTLIAIFDLANSKITNTDAKVTNDID